MAKEARQKPNSRKLIARYIAMSESRHISTDKTLPLTDTTIVSAHNIFDQTSSQCTLTEALNLGIRGVELGLYMNKDDICLCHNIDKGVGIKYKRTFSNILVEIKDWLQHNKNEVIILKLDSFLKNRQKEKLVKILQKNLGKKLLFTPKDRASSNTNWPDFNKISKMGKQVIVMVQGNRNTNLTFDAKELKKFKYQSKMVTRHQLPDKFSIHQTSETGNLTTKDVKELNNAGIEVTKVSNGLKISNYNYILIPAKIISKTLKVSQEKAISWLNTAQKSLIDSLITSVLPVPCKLAYLGAREGAETYVNSAEPLKKKAIDISASSLLRAAESAAKMSIGYSNTVAQEIINTSTTHNTGFFVGMMPKLINAIRNNLSAKIMMPKLINAARNTLSAKIVVDPIIGIIKEMYNRVTKKTDHPTSLTDSLEKGFRHGVDASTFGLTSFSSQGISGYDQMIQSTAARWKNYLTKHDIATQNYQKTYDEWVKKNTDQYLKTHPHIQKADLFDIPFNVVDSCLQKEMQSLGKILAKAKVAIHSGDSVSTIHNTRKKEKDKKFMSM